MSYATEVRGALAQTSGLARRVMALRELGLPEEDVEAIQGHLDQAVEEIMAVADRLKVHGITATGMELIQAGNERTQRLNRLAEDTSWMERAKGNRSAPKRKRTYEEVFPEDSAPAVAPAQQMDAAHPWRTA